MRIGSGKMLRKLLCCGLILAMMMFNLAAVYAADESPEQAGPEAAASGEMNNQIEVQEPSASSYAAPDSESSASVASTQSSEANPETVTSAQNGEANPETVTSAQSSEASPETVTSAQNGEANPETVTSAQKIDESSEPATSAMTEDNTETTGGRAADSNAETATNGNATGAADSADHSTDHNVDSAADMNTTSAASGNESAAAGRAAGSSTDAAVAGGAATRSANSAAASSTNTAAANNTDAAAANNTDAAATRSANGSAAGTIHIGDTSFGSGDEESSHWEDGKGWKNVAGQYIAMVDFDGSAAEISADSGVVKLAVAGVNRIHALTGDCSYQISGSGIVLIDKIDIGDGRSISLCTNTALYKEGSAAVFVRQEDGSYLLINGEITGILDELYDLDNIRLTVPKDSSLTLSALAIRKETWKPDGVGEPVTDVMLYSPSIPFMVEDPVHDFGVVTLDQYAGRLTIGKNSTLTIEDGGSVLLQTLEKTAVLGNEYTPASLVIQGILNIAGIVEGGYVDVNDGGTLTGTGTIQSATVNLEPSANLSTELLIDDSSVLVNGTHSANVKDSVIYLEGADNYIPDLTVTGVSRIVSRTIGSIGSASVTGVNNIGNIILNAGSSLDILAHDHTFFENDDFNQAPTRFIEDFCLIISGRIVGNVEDTVNVLAGLVEYTGPQSDNLPVVPYGYASRLLVFGSSMSSRNYPISMTASYALGMAKRAQIPVERMTVKDSLVSEEIAARSWKASGVDFATLIDRDPTKTYTGASFIEEIGFEPLDSAHYMGVEVVHSDLSRHIYWIDDEETFTTDDVVILRVVDCIGEGGQGGSSITHTTSSVTGSGVIGNPGSGFVTTGTKTVVYSNGDPVDDDPVQDPDDNPADNDDDNNNTNNNTNNNSNNNSNNNGNNNNSGNRKSNNNNKKNAGNNTANNADRNGNFTTAGYTTDSGARDSTNASSVRTGNVVVTVTLLESLTEAASSAGRESPQIWQLEVTSNGTPVTELTGKAAAVKFPFTVPDTWGDPAKLDNGSLYAVFAGGKDTLTANKTEADGKDTLTANGTEADEEEKLTAYRAEYDAKTGEISFEAEKTGRFVIVKFDYEDEPFTEDFYRELAQQENVKAFLEVL